MSNTLVTSKTERFEMPSNWSSTQNKDYFFSADQMIEAYEKGCSDGFSIQINKMRTEFIANLKEATNKAVSFFNTINADNEICMSIYLRVTDTNQFDLLFTIDKEIFFNPKVSRAVYAKSFEFEKQNPSLSISFLPNLENINLNRLSSDRYLFAYGNSQPH